jgi:hypothetical protein
VPATAIDHQFEQGALKMFSLFRSRRDRTTTVVSGMDRFFREFERMKASRSVFNAQGDAHGDIDMRLTSRIEEHLRPLFGKWEGSTTWFHQMDYYGDGVRALTLRRDIFPRQTVPSLQAMLAGEHSAFTILCIVTDDMMDDSPKTSAARDFLALFSARMLITEGLANQLSMGPTG